ncbi:MAG TPA: rhomboid family intramembrane serine protease [Pyrinomonadaceae bacterium]|nr:rhomboid family intramembrane serine protease [Chloracidobacterium sp.]HQX55573.1 rhomboid family intramembrane serine protease [Pyrinomonadaceae bacterium]MBK7801644.1 rhomboid family intramembrane serine protease [Chloracidobacterium sp.]MBK9436960.1 rhomboid family intramembrane serine protease [Chloracidobacterium sp.]MBL0241954.1 rhomboid family intramembrane serine protease [Chloracidobacterium sp.]
MFPIGDDNSDRRIQPVVNYGFIAVNILVFLLLQQLGGNEAFTYAFSLVPKEITTGVDLNGIQILRDSLGRTAEIHHYASPLPVYFNFLSSMFMHGDIMHIFGNMMFLFIFGDNLENLLGHIRYVVFYLVCGIAAASAQILMGPDSIIPMLGASGAISGVLGGYLLLFPNKPVKAIIFNFLTTVPAYVALGIWIVYQLVIGYLTPSGGGGVAYAAHIGGFVAGLVLIKVFAIGRKA